MTSREISLAQIRTEQMLKFERRAAAASYLVREADCAHLDERRLLGEINFEGKNKIADFLDLVEMVCGPEHRQELAKDFSSPDKMKASIQVLSILSSGLLGGHAHVERKNELFTILEGQGIYYVWKANETGDMRGIQ